MINSIQISNYALIDKVEIELTPGLNIITGETGAGKSIMLGALSLLLGARADTKVVTDTTRKSVIEAVFDLSDNADAKEFFNLNGLEWNEDNTAILRREIAPNGRSRAFINDSPVTLSVLEDLSKHLIDIHSQHQNLLLANPAFQLQIIDALAQDNELLALYRSHYQEYKKAIKLYNSARKDLETIRNREGELREQLDSILDLNLSDGEQEELEKEREQLENYTFIKEQLGSLLRNVGGVDNSAIDLLRNAVIDSESLKGMIPDGESLHERLNSAYIEIEDIFRSYGGIDNEMTDDPKRLEWIEDRLEKIYRLEKKLGCDNIAALLSYAGNLELRLDSIDTGGQRLTQLQKDAKEKRAMVLETARSLSAVRHAEADKFIRELEEKAAPLGMRNIKAVADFSYTNELTPEGIDHIEFKFAFNKNQDPLPISHTASGGEISRLMLCVKNILASRMQFPTIIFDEVDTGVSGEVADKMGAMMLDISAGIQVLAITHLPQVAAKGTTHFKVFKVDDDEQTHTRLQRLDPEDRVKEIAVMLSGKSVSETAMENARILLNQTD